MLNDDVAPYQNVVVKEFTSSAVNEDWNLYFKFLYKFPTCLCSYCCYLLTIVVLLLFQNQKFNCNTIFTWMNYPACLVSLVLFVKLHLIIRLCNLSNEIIDNYSFQQKRVNCSKVSGYQQRNTDQRGPSDSRTTHYSLPEGQHSMVQRKRQQASLVVLQRWTPRDDLVVG